LFAERSREVQRRIAAEALPPLLVAAEEQLLKLPLPLQAAEVEEPRELPPEQLP
jgi:hypothetical protein